MIIKKLFVILLILALVILVGCGNKQYSKDIVVVVNGKTISEKDIQKEIIERNMTIALSNAISSVESKGMVSKDALIKNSDVNDDNLTSQQLQYIESIERSTIKPLSNNEAFNILLREVVLYQEALKEGYKVLAEDAKQILTENKQVTDEMLKNNKEAQQKQSEILESYNKIYKQFGFESEEDYLNQRIDNPPQALTISRMKNQFNKIIINKISKVNGIQMVVEKQNAWDDYSEYLIKKSSVKILNKEYSIETYGEPWDYGILKLK